MVCTLYHFRPSPQSSPPGQALVCSLYLWVCFSFVMFAHLFCFLDFTYKWKHTVFVFPWLISLSIMLSMSIQVATNGKISFFFYGWVMFHCICIPHLLYSFICQWTLRLCLYLATLNNASMNIVIHISFWISVFIFCEKCHGYFNRDCTESGNCFV